MSVRHESGPLEVLGSQALSAPYNSSQAHR
jgi:hypothetical protein